MILEIGRISSVISSEASDFDPCILEQQTFSSYTIDFKGLIGNFRHAYDVEETIFERRDDVVTFVTTLSTVTLIPGRKLFVIFCNTILSKISLQMKESHDLLRRNLLSGNWWRNPSIARCAIFRKETFSWWRDLNAIFDDVLRSTNHARRRDFNQLKHQPSRKLWRT